MEELFTIAVDAPLPEALTYKAPPLMGVTLSRGMSVRVPLGKRAVNGVVIGPTSVKPDFQLKEIKEVIEEQPKLPDAFLKWLEWISQYYMYPLGQVVALAYPPLKKRATPRKSKRSPVIPDIQLSSAPQFTEEQLHVIRSITPSLNKFSVHLLQGVTGSGKTEVYMKLLDEVLAQGKSGLILVPEISLTPQLLNRFSSRFPGQIAVIHSHLTEREKTEQWWAASSGEKKILIGARSALFCPIENLGLIILDEEHEPSYKQDEKLKYHARDSAIMLAKFHSAPIVLGSATPSLESYQNALDGRYQLHQMKARVQDRPLPNIEVIDLKETRSTRRDPTVKNSNADALPFWLTQKLYDELAATLARKEQSALFLNRRGVAQTVLCPSCGFVHECPNCAISLTLHGRNQLVCHYCDYNLQMKDNCPKCADGIVSPMGLGTELIENDIQKLFPEARLARADRDEINSREAMEELIKDVEDRNIDILIGTQMIAKGLDFPGLTLVGLVLADVGFHLPDFRASERSFQLLTQMAGRSGRHSENPGTVIVQTYNTEHQSLKAVVQKDFHQFAEQELSERRALFYPPFSRIAMVKIQGASLQLTEEACRVALARAEQLKEKRPEYAAIRILGPSPSPIAKLRNKFRFQMLIKSPGHKELNAFCHQLLSDQKWVPTSTKVQIDIDPMNML